MEHEPWVGDRFSEGIDGQRLLIFGFSHYGSYDDGHDDSDFTKYVIKKWALSGKIPFFKTLTSYFDFDKPDEFYRRISFANTLPYSVGEEGNKFSSGDKASLGLIDARVRRLIFQIDPNKVIVFSTKGWTLFPWYDDRSQDGKLEVSKREPINYGGYKRASGGYAMAYGLRHPMMAPWQMMHASVQAIMQHRVQDADCLTGN